MNLMSKKKQELALKEEKELDKIEKNLPEIFAKFLGTDKANFAKRALFLIQDIAAHGETSEERSDEAMAAASEMLLEFQPRNGVEAMLAIQMTISYEAAMKCMKRATEAKELTLHSAMIKNGHKMMQAFLEHLRMLHKLRGGGDQKMVIEHVNVAPGAQAIVGTVHHAPAQALPKPSRQAITHQHQVSLPAPKKRKPTKNVSRKK
jgi:hypothetical protein